MGKSRSKKMLQILPLWNAALDVTEEKLALARASGAGVTVNAKSPDAAVQFPLPEGGRFRSGARGLALAGRKLGGRSAGLLRPAPLKRGGEHREAHGWDGDGIAKR